MATTHIEKSLRKAFLHVDAVACEQLAAFCQPFFEEFGVNYFDYARIYPDQTCHALFSSLDYAEFFLNYRFQAKSEPDYKVPVSFLTPGKHLWQAYICERFLTDASNYFNKFYGITIITQYPSYLEIYNIGTDINHSNILELFMNHDYIFHTFVSFFKEQYSYLFNRSDSRILISDWLGAPKIGHKNNFDRLQNSLKKMVKMRKDNVLIGIDGNVAKLSYRELECLNLVLQGFSNKHISKYLNVSPRTVETYVNNLLSKTRAQSRGELRNSISEDLAKDLEKSFGYLEIN